MADAWGTQPFLAGCKRRIEVWDKRNTTDNPVPLGKRDPRDCIVSLSWGETSRIIDVAVDLIYLGNPSPRLFLDKQSWKIIYKAESLGGRKYDARCPFKRVAFFEWPHTEESSAIKFANWLAENLDALLT